MVGVQLTLSIRSQLLSSAAAITDGRVPDFQFPENTGYLFLVGF